MADTDTLRGLRYGRGPMMRYEAALRTACGCEKVVSVPYGGFDDIVRVPITDTRDRYDYSPAADMRCTIRQFVFGGELDRVGRRVYQEHVDKIDPTDWKTRYQDLYNEIYGVDKGL